MIGRTSGGLLAYILSVLLVFRNIYIINIALVAIQIPQVHHFSGIHFYSLLLHLSSSSRRLLQLDPIDSKLAECKSPTAFTIPNTILVSFVTKLNLLYSMSQEPPYQQLAEEFGSAFNVEGLTEIQITWEGKGKILGGIVDRARWWLGLGNRSQEPQNYQQAITGVREVIAANTNDSRFINLSTSWALNVSRSFFDKVCSLVEESERKKNVEKIGPQKRTPGQRRILPAPAPSAQPSSSAAANSPQSTPFFLQETSIRRGEPPSLFDALNPAPANSTGATSNRKRKFSEDSAVSKRGGKDKGKGRAILGSYAGTGATLTEPLTVDSIEKDLLRGIPSPVGIGGAGPSNWVSSLKGPGTIHYPIQLIVSIRNNITP